MLLAAGVVITWLTRAGAARAQERADGPDDSDEPRPGLDAPRSSRVGFSDRPLVMAANLGFGTPVGELGGTLEYSPASIIAVGGGLGTGLGGLQLAALARLRPLVWERRKRALAITFGTAFSTGPYHAVRLDLAPDDRPRLRGSDWAYWLQFDVGFELRNRNGFAFLVSVGTATMLNPESLSCESGSIPAACPRPNSLTLPTVTVALGYAF